MDLRGAVPDRRPAAGMSVYESIKSLIMTNEIAPGGRLNIEELARRFGVSPTPVREALKQLEGDRLAVRSAGRGYVTTSLLDLDRLRQMFETRLLIEPWVAKVAAADRATNPGDSMQREIERFSGADMDEPRRALTRHDTTFHDLLFGAVGNEFLSAAFVQIHTHMHLFRLYPADPDGSITVAEHQAIADAVSARDAPAAEAAMRTHLVSALDRFSAIFRDGARPGLRGAEAPRTLL